MNNAIKLFSNFPKEMSGAIAMKTDGDAKAHFIQRLTWATGLNVKIARASRTMSNVSPAKVLAGFLQGPEALAGSIHRSSGGYLNS